VRLTVGGIDLGPDGIVIILLPGGIRQEVAAESHDERDAVPVDDPEVDLVFPELGMRHKRFRRAPRARHGLEQERRAGSLDENRDALGRDFGVIAGVRGETSEPDDAGVVVAIRQFRIGRCGAKRGAACIPGGSGRATEQIEKAEAG
jgi:hypothetical protein